ncbi:Uncharacterised protein [Sphingobacterium spiritivorum]|nr:Uncharacterised protein [Sphingobacterium spiritivorum]
MYIRILTINIGIALTKLWGTYIVSKVFRLSITLGF